MNYHNKYLKYKQKYLELKNIYQSTLNNKYGGALNNKYVITKFNNGSLDGMTNQCLWISILDYLNTSEDPELNIPLSLKELRFLAGLSDNTEHTQFDINNPIYVSALNSITIIFDLKITFIPVDENGLILYNGDLIEIRGSGNNNINIAQYGTFHFQLITGFSNTNNNQFRPIIQYRNKFVELSQLPENLKKLNLDLINQQAEIKQLKKQLKINNSQYNDELETKKYLMTSNELSPDEKSTFITQQDKSIDTLVNEINGIETRINRLEEEITSLMIFISEFDFTVGGVTPPSASAASHSSYIRPPKSR